MGIILQIAHPNDILANQWKAVDEISHENDIEQYLESPSFDYSAGTCFRAIKSKKIVYSAILKEQGYIAVGPETKFMDENWSNEMVDDYSPGIRKMDLFDRYSKIHGPELLDGLHEMVYEKDAIRAMCACVKAALSYCPTKERLPYRLVSAVERWLTRPSNAKESNLFTLGEACEDRGNIFYNEDNVVYPGFTNENIWRVHHAASYLAATDDYQTEFLSINYAESALIDKTTSQRSKIIGDEIRKALPFHLIVQRILALE